MRFIPLLLLLTLTLLNAKPREALLIGNSNYNFITDLKNPKPSINRLKIALEKLNFHVVTAYDLDSENLSAEVAQFRDRLSPDTIGFFYYSGHGCQLSHQSYLVPTNVDTQKSAKIKYHALGISEILYMLNSANNAVNMLFLDACRDVPIGSTGGSKGLGQIGSIPKGTMVVYATEVGKVAEDSTLFISELTKTILKPNRKILEIGNHLSYVIASKTDDKQIPEMFSKKLPPKLVLLKRGREEPSSKWISPTKKKLIWKEAKKICKENGARLATIEELEKVVTDCGGVFISFGDKDWSSLSDKNELNKPYQSCYKEKGFKHNAYWSSTTYAHNVNDAWLVSFDYGNEYINPKDSSLYVRCVRGGE